METKKPQKQEEEGVSWLSPHQASSAGATALTSRAADTNSLT